MPFKAPPGYYDNDRHRCWGKIRMLYEQTGLLLSHDEINYMCEAILQCTNAMDFHRTVGGMSNDELKDVMKKSKDEIKNKTKEKIKERTGVTLNSDEVNYLYDELQKENTDSQGRWIGFLTDVEKMSDDELKKRVKKAQDEVKEKMKKMRRRLGLPELEVMREEAQRAYQ